MDRARAEMCRIITAYLEGHESGPTIVPGLGVARLTEPMPIRTYHFEPSLCVGTRGSKRILIGDIDRSYDEHRFFLTSVGLPTITEVPAASPTDPYVALQITLDLDMTREVIAEIDAAGTRGEASTPGVVTAPVTPDMLEAVLRLVRLLESPRDIPLLHAMIHREILVRILTGVGGDRLRQMVRLGSKGDQISRAVSWLRAHYAEKLRVEDLAHQVGMALSTFHKNFRDITTISPLQYQKLLRLHEARRRMLAKDTDAATAAFAVGYESVTQFNREYSRLFGAPPVQDVKRLRQPNAPKSQPW